jgi:hypothetical protein
MMNRRHIIHNGTVNIMMITQKFSLIPAHVRTNCNWFVLFKMTPMDSDKVFQDVITVSGKSWKNILNYVFGDGSTEGVNSAGEQKDSD